MEIKDFKNKYIDDITLEELEWLNNNSYVNEYAYVGRKMVLTEQVPDWHLLLDFYPPFKGFLNYYNMLMKYRNIDFFNILLQKQRDLYEYINLNYDKFITNRELIKEFSLIYLIFYDIFQNYIKNIYSKHNTYIRFIYMTWKYPLVRDLNQEKKESIKLRYVMTLAEHGEYKEALTEILKIAIDDEIKKEISIYYYTILLAKKVKDKNILNKYIKKSEKFFNDKKLENIWCLTLLKLSLIYLEINDKDKYNNMIHKAFNNFKNNKNIFLKDSIYNKNYDSNVLTMNAEIIREFHLNLYYSLLRGFI